jgi:hypothetical protein
MTRPALLAALVSLAALTASPADAFWGRKNEALPDRREAAAKSLLWVPAAGSLDWPGLRSFFEKRAGARLTIALAPEEIPEDEKLWLATLREEGRVEIAIRIQGDPILPLAGEERPGLAAEKLAMSRIRFKKVFGEFPAGFAPGGGAITPGGAAPLARLGLKWTAVGDGEFFNPWYGDEQLVLVPFHAITRTELDALPPATETPALVIDEAAGTLDPGSGLGIVERLLDASGESAFTTVSQGLSLVRPFAVGPETWPSWADSLAFWNGSEAQRTAWSLYRGAAKQIVDYQNSGSASIARLNKAEAELQKAGSARYYVEENLRDPDLETEFRAALKGVYRLAGKPAPRRLRRPLATPLETDDSPLATPAAEEHSKDEVFIDVAAESLTLRNPEQSLAALPAEMPELEAETTGQHLWTPRAVSVSWNEKTVDFTIMVLRLSPNEDAPFGFEHLLVDLYVDLNRLSGRGSTALLARRRGFLDPQDAWEYAIVVSGWQSGLYRSLPGHPPALVEPLEPEVDASAGTLKVSVPRRLLRGNPARWGYVLTTMAGDAASLDQSPPLPLPGETGSPLLGMLGSLEEQRNLTTKRKSTYRRFSAQRADRPTH